MADWYYAKAGKQFGPITSAELKRMAQAGELVPDDLVFQEGGTQWVSASTVKGLFNSSGTGVRSLAAARPDPDREPEEERAPTEPLIDRSSRPPRKRSYWVELLLFRRLIAPTIIM